MSYYPDIIQALRTIPIFLDLQEFQLSRLAEFAELVDFEPNETIMTEGEKPDCIYFVLEGDIKVEVFVPTRGNVETSRLGPLDVLGWSALTPMVRQRTGTATAIVSTSTICLERKKLIALCEEDRDIGFIIYKRISNVAAGSFLTTRLQLMNLIVEANQMHPAD